MRKKSVNTRRILTSGNRLLRNRNVWNLDAASRKNKLKILSKENIFKTRDII